MNESQNVYEEIENIVGTKYISDVEPIRYSYSMNCDYTLQGIPDIVVKPRSTVFHQNSYNVIKCSITHSCNMYL